MPVTFWHAAIQWARLQIWNMMMEGRAIGEFELRYLVGDEWNTLSVVDIAFLRTLTTKFAIPPPGKVIMLEIKHARDELAKINSADA